MSIKAQQMGEARESTSMRTRPLRLAEPLSTSCALVTHERHASTSVVKQASQCLRAAASVAQQAPHAVQSYLLDIIAFELVGERSPEACHVVAARIDVVLRCVRVCHATVL